VTDQEVKVDPAPGISCLAKDGETADCSKDPAVVKEAIKLIEKSPHPNAAVRVIQRSKQSGNHATIRRTSRGSPLQTDQTTKLQRKVKDLERQLKRRSKGRKQRSRKRSRGRSTKLAKRVKDLERKLSRTRVELAKMQVAAKSFKKKKRTRKQSSTKTCHNGKLKKKVKDLERQLKRSQMRPMKGKRKRKGHARKSKRKRKKYNPNWKVVKPVHKCFGVVKYKKYRKKDEEDELKESDESRLTPLPSPTASSRSQSPPRRRVRMAHSLPQRRRSLSMTPPRLSKRRLTAQSSRPSRPSPCSRTTCVLASPSRTASTHTRCHSKQCRFEIRDVLMFNK